MPSAFAPVGHGSGKLVDLFGYTRFGRNQSPNPVLIGRHESKENLNTGPGPYCKPDKTGQYKPNALIVSRPKLKLVGSGAGKFENVYGKTRFGPAHPPSAVIVSRHELKDKNEPGPGAYDPQKLYDKHVGILIKSRLKGLELNSPQPGANYYEVPPLTKGPAYTLGLGWQCRELKSQSPGPIYKVPPIQKRGLSLTFKPFPMRGKEEDPGPLHYGTLPGEQAISSTLYHFPSVKFGKEFCASCEYPPPSSPSIGPGPAAYSIGHHKSHDDRPHAVLMSRPRFRYESCGSGKMKNLFGMTRFGPARPPNPVLCSRHPIKEKFSPSPGAYDPQKLVDKKVGILIKSRLKGLELNSPQPGPKYNLSGYLGTGPAFSLGAKNAGAQPRIIKIPDADYKDLSDCYPKKVTPDPVCCIPPSEPAPGTIFQKSFPTDPVKLIPILENMITEC